MTTIINAGMSEVVRRGLEIYDSTLRPRLETPQNKGKIVVIDIDSGDFEMDRSHIAASRRLRERHPDGRRFVARVGYPTVTKHGYLPTGASR